MPKDTPHSSVPSFRTRHRARSHENAHADDAAGDAEPTFAHPLVPREPVPLITQRAALHELIDHLRGAKCFAYDSEFIGELTYVPKLCLLQVASSQRVALIDPLAGLDLTPFWELIADTSVTKIVHAGDQDIEPVVHHLDREAANVFDTQIVAGFVGMAYPVSLSRLVTALLGVKLGKGLTFTHWDQRPLSKSQLRYAADDVRYLPAVHALLSQHLAETGHAAWALAECADLCEASQYRFDPDTQLQRVRGVGSLNGQALAVLRELVIWRDAAAREENVPPRAFVKDEVLVDLARSPVKSVEKLERVRGLPRPVEIAHGAAIVAVTAQGLARPANQRPRERHVEESPVERFRADAFWSAAQALCAGRQIDPAVVSSRQDAGEFYRLIQSNGDVASHRLMQGWRREALGEPLLELLRGRKRFVLGWADQRPQSTIAEE